MGRLTEVIGFLNDDPRFGSSYIPAYISITPELKEYKKKHKVEPTLNFESMNEERAIVRSAETRLPKFVEDAYDTVEKMEAFAKILLGSKLVPFHFYEKGPDNKPDFTKGKTEAVVAVLIQGYQLQLPPLTALQHIIPVNGLLSIKGDLAKSMIFNSGKLKTGSWKETEEGSIDQESLVVSITASRIDNGQTITRSFSVAQAKRAGLWITTQQVNGQDGWKYKQSPWFRYPARMINYRALGFLARDLFPDVMSGIYTTEEAADMPVDQTIVIDQGNGVVVQIPDQQFAQQRSQQMTQRASSKIKDKDFSPVDPPQKEQPKPDPPHIANAQDDMGMADQPVYEGPHNVGPPSKEPPLTQEQINAMTGGRSDLPFDRPGMDQPPPHSEKEQQQQHPTTPDEATQKLTIAQMSEMETEDLMKLIQNDSEMAEALMLIPGKNTNKKLREIIFAYQEGTLAEHVKPFLSEGEQTPPAEGNSFEGRDPAQDPAPEPDLEQPATSDLNKYNLEIPPWNKGNERDFATTRLLYQRMLDLNPRLDNERFLELQQKLPQFSNHVSKEAFCKYASVEDVCLLLNNN